MATDTPLTLVLPLHNSGDRLTAHLQTWFNWLNGQKFAGQLILVDDGSSDDTATLAGEFADKWPSVQLLRHDQPQGLGACLRTALAEAHHDYFAYALADYPYEPKDLAKMLERCAQTDPNLKMPIGLVNGCRTGVPVPTAWRLLGRVVRAFSRVVLGLSLPKLPGWLGFQEHFRSWWAWFIFADPMTDPNCGLKVMRKSLFDSFPIQCNGDTVHLEIVAKATFITTLMDEIPLSPKSAAIPKARWDEAYQLFVSPKFHVRNQPAASTEPDTSEEKTQPEAAEATSLPSPTPAS